MLRMPLTTATIHRNDPGLSREAYAAVTSALRSAILDGDLVPGERLPGESQLCELFSVSRSTVREAIRALASEHLLVIVRGAGGGTFVGHPTATDIVASLTAMFRLATGSDEFTFAELIDVRVLLESHAARLAAIEREPHHVAALRAALPPGSARARRTATEAFDSNFAFHDAVLAAAGNRVVQVVTMPIFSTLHQRVRRDSRQFPAQRILREHRAIAEAIADGDPTGATSLMRSHLVGLVPVYSALERTA